MVIHAKERCTSCGVWRDKTRECYLCKTFPNRAQVHSDSNLRKQAMSQVVTPTAPSAHHTKERCTSCGVWKDKTRSCYLCATMINRAQATAAQLSSAAKIEMSPVKRLHTKERCTSCGVWKDKQLACYQCTYLPNRLQVAISSPRIDRASHVI